jgi:hypothetical protein
MGRVLKKNEGRSGVFFFKKKTAVDNFFLKKKQKKPRMQLNFADEEANSIYVCASDHLPILFTCERTRFVWLNLNSKRYRYAVCHSDIQHHHDVFPHDAIPNQGTVSLFVNSSHSNVGRRYVKH